MDRLITHIESLIFTTDQPISLKEIKTCLEEVLETKFKKEELLEAIDQIKQRYEDDAYAFTINEIAEGYQFLTKPAYHHTVGTFLKQTTRKRLSRAALETLSIIAYKQPVTKSEMEKIRGVSCDYSIQKLLEKELVAIVGRDEGPGRPLLYGTSEKFMDYFGINSLRDLPKPKDFKEADFQIGEQAPIEEDAPPAMDTKKEEEE
ncbi:MAG: SMC-Scp complex subunit ScpB [Chitinophagales bacterium]|nr:SMC-Scp complex subunit ScpB [Chitinophagales bacterium]